jgi:choline dehydrogenase-like flavoprotein
MRPHYKAILDEIPYAGEEDALAQHFPLVGKAQPLPELAPRARAVITAAKRHERALKRMGVTVGKARLAFNSTACVRCGLCMTGCPYSLIYSASQTFDKLRQASRIEYHDNLLAVEVGQDGDVPFVVARQLGSQGSRRFEADRVYVATGALGTTRLILSSLRLFDQDVELVESVQFVMPMLSLRPTPDPRLSSEFTLNQFNMVVSIDEDWRDVSQIHFYPHNDAILDGLPGLFATKWAAPLTDQLLRRLTVGLGYLPSWVSPPLRVRAERPANIYELPRLRVDGDLTHGSRIPMFRQVMRKVIQAAPCLDLWPVLPSMFFSAPGKSYHFGGAFPHSETPADGPLTTDRLGRMDRWPRIHLVDASVFPTVPATTFTLTIMANAHRIATETLALPD